MEIDTFEAVYACGFAMPWAQRGEGAAAADIIDLEHNLPHVHTLNLSVVHQACGLSSDTHSLRRQFEGGINITATLKCYNKAVTGVANAI